MGLRNQPEFETMEQTEAETATETVTKEETTMSAETKSAEATASVAATTAIAAAATGTAVAAHRPATKLKLAFAEQQGVFDIATVEGLGLAVPRIKGEQGSFFNGPDELGTKIRFEIVSISPRWVVGTGTNDKEAKDFFRVSYDKKTISGDGGDLYAYLEDLKAQGFDKASISDYLDIFGFVTWTEKKGDIDIEARELSCLQCSPTSKGAFTAFATTRGLLESKGVAKPIDVVEVHAEKRVSGDNKFTNFSFHAPK